MFILSHLKTLWCGLNSATSHLIPELHVLSTVKASCMAAWKNFNFCLKAPHWYINYLYTNDFLSKTTKTKKYPFFWQELRAGPFWTIFFFFFNIVLTNKSNFDLKSMNCRALQQLFAPTNKRLAVRRLPASPAITASKFHRALPSTPPPPNLLLCNQTREPKSHHLWDIRHGSTGQSFSSQPLWSKHLSCYSVHLSSLMIFFSWCCHPTFHPSALFSFPLFPLNLIMGLYE